MCISMGKSHVIDPKIDKGKWYNYKKRVVEASMNPEVSVFIAPQSFHYVIQSYFHVHLSNFFHQLLSQLSQHNIQFPSEGWRTFPSVGIPRMFNYGNIYHHLVESMPLYWNEDEVEMDSEDESDSIEDESSDVQEDPFDEEYSTVNETKKLRRGLQFLKSKYVRKVQDTYVGRCYFVKAQVRASMECEAYKVKVAISTTSGNISICTCTCKQQSLGRCSHVSAVLLHIWRHVRLHGYGGKWN